MVRLQQVLIVLAGLVLAGTMIVLGLWQAGVYRAGGTASSAERATAAPVALTEVAPANTPITDGYGRSVRFTGSYVPTLQVLVDDDSAGRRVVTGFRLGDGRLLAVVRGVTTGTPPAPPAGVIEQTGVLLPSENSGDPANSVRVPLLAQTWPGQLIEGYVNLMSDESVAQGVHPSPLDLPPAPGRLRNGAYALQWWLFGGFAVVMAVRIARDLDRGHDLELAAEADAAAADSADTADAEGATPARPTADRQESEEHSATT